ncbi:hypothetical protein QBC46DRAFT_419709, partial [Diplogelasinospora grovesii]
DHARDQSYALRDQLKEHWKQRRGVLQPIAEIAPPPVLHGSFEATNADEDEAGYEIVEHPCEPTPPTSSKPERLGGQTRKASLSSQGSSHESSKQRSKGKNYWKWDAERGQCFHKHSDGRVTWLKGSD